MGNTDNWIRAKANGDIGEAVVKNVLEEMYEGCQVEQLPYEIWGKKADFRLTFENGKERYIEVKTDSKIHMTNNIYIEEFNRNKGWIYNDYQWIFEVDLFNHCIYILRFDKLKNMYQCCGSYIEKFNEAEGCTHCGYVCPIAELIDWEVITYKIELDETNHYKEKIKLGGEIAC